MPTPTLQLLYNPGEYIPYPIAPEGVPTVTDTATMEDLSPETKALFDVNPEAKYIMKDVVKNNIFSENDLLEPLDTHIGNFMYGKDGVLRATDIHKQRGKI